MPLTDAKPMGAWAKPELFNDPEDSAFAGDFKRELEARQKEMGGSQELWDAALQREIQAIMADPNFPKGPSGPWGSGSNPYEAARLVAENFKGYNPGVKAPTYDDAQAQAANTTAVGRSKEGVARANDDDGGFMGLGDLGTLAAIAAAIYSGGSALGAWGGAEAGIGALGAAEEAAMLGGGLGELGAIAPGGAGAGVGAGGGFGGGAGGLDFDEFGNLLPGTSGGDNLFPTGSEDFTGAWSGSGMGPDFDEFGNMLPGESGTDNTFPTGTEDFTGAWPGDGGLSFPSWLKDLLKQSGESGVDPASLEGGFNPAGSGLTVPPGDTFDWLKKLLGGGGSGGGSGAGGDMDWLKTLLTGGAGLYQDIAKNDQSKSLMELAQRYEGYGAPSRARYESSYAPGFSMTSDPGFKDALDQSAKATLHGLSTAGNPFDSPNAWAASLDDLYKKNAYPALQTYRNQNALSGGISNASAVAPNIFSNAINAESQVGAGTAGALGSIFNPPTSLADLLKQLRL